MPKRGFGILGLAVGLLFAAAASAMANEAAQRAAKVSFYFAAHQDDWQLFMNPSAFLDVTDRRTKAVFVHLTAGDAGSGIGTRGRKHPFYLARENGAEAAIRFMADKDEMPVERIAGKVTLNGHALHRVTYRNTVSYFLRLPDGNVTGLGYPATGNQSLLRLQNGQVKSLTAIDRTTTYQGWNDLVATLRAIIDYERTGAAAVQLNVSETDLAINPEDHPDHQMTATAALDAAKGLTCARRLHYVDYASSKLPENISAAERDMDSAVFAVTAAGIRAFDHSQNWLSYNNNFVGRNYFRVEEGTGRCDSDGPEIATAKPAMAGQQLAGATPVSSRQ